MAKLSARGRYTVVSLTREGTPHEGLTIRETKSLRLMSDNTVLERSVVWFAAGPYDNGNDRRHDYGWKVKGKLAIGKTPETFRETFLGPRKDGSPSPWKLDTNVRR